MYSVTVFCLCLLAHRAAAMSMPAKVQDGVCCGRTSGYANTPVTCSVEGQTLQANEKRKIGSFVYECQKTNNYARTTIVGCVGEDGTEHNIGDQWTQGEGKFKYISECTKDESGVTKIHVVYCQYEGPEGSAKLSAGQQQQVGDALVGCEKMGENGMQYRVTYNKGNGQNSNANQNSNTGADCNNANCAKCVNCVPNANTGTTGTTGGGTNAPTSCQLNGQKLELNQRTTSGSFVYVCEQDGSSARAVIVGCVDDKKVEQPINGQWQVGNGKFKYIYECSKQSDGTVVIKGVYCLFQSGEGSAQVAPGQQQQVGRALLSCEQSGQYGLAQKVTYPNSKTDCKSNGNCVPTTASPSNPDCKSNGNCVPTTESTPNPTTASPSYPDCKSNGNCVPTTESTPNPTTASPSYPDCKSNGNCVPTTESTPNPTTASPSNPDCKSNGNCVPTTESTPNPTTASPSNPDCKSNGNCVPSTDCKSNGNCVPNTGSSQAYCSVDGQKLELNQRVTSGRFVYECQKTSTGTQSAIVACLDTKNGEHSLDQEYEEGEGDFKYIYECVKDSEGKTAVRGVYCLYQSKEGSAKLAPEQKQQVGKVQVGCDRNGENGLQYNMDWNKGKTGNGNCEKC